MVKAEGGTDRRGKGVRGYPPKKLSGTKSTAGVETRRSQRKGRRCLAKTKERAEKGKAVKINMTYQQ